MFFTSDKLQAWRFSTLSTPAPFNSDPPRGIAFPRVWAAYGSCTHGAQHENHAQHSQFSAAGIYNEKRRRRRNGHIGEMSNIHAWSIFISVWRWWCGTLIYDGELGLTCWKLEDGEKCRKTRVTKMSPRRLARYTALWEWTGYTQNQIDEAKTIKKL